MAKQSAAIECNNCASVCTVVGTNADTVQFCPFCGEDVLLPYVDVDDPSDETFVYEDDEEQNDDRDEK